MNVSISYDFFENSPNPKDLVNLENFCVVVIDVLRASTTICTLLELCDNVYITDCVEKAEKIENSLKVGERDGKKIESFDFGNSPVEILSNKEKIKEHIKNSGKLVITTTNGTRVLENILSDDVLIGSITNAKYVAEKACEIAKEKKKDIMLVPAHRKGKFAIEDYIGAGLILNHILTLLDENISPENFEELIPARNLTKTDWVRKVLESNSSENLKKLGYYDDLLFSVSENTQKSVGTFDKKLGIIRSV